MNKEEDAEEGWRSTLRCSKPIILHSFLISISLAGRAGNSINWLTLIRHYKYFTLMSVYHCLSLRCVCMYKILSSSVINKCAYYHNPECHVSEGLQQGLWAAGTENASQLVTHSEDRDGQLAAGPVWHLHICSLQTGFWCCFLTHQKNQRSVFSEQQRWLQV